MGTSFSKEIFEEGGTYQVSSFDLIWRLIVLLLLSKDNDDHNNKD